tara:strand:+ start:1487 stop:1675 length:189 start_codon:yes stop_codon:yes gene_type:complete
MYSFELSINLTTKLLNILGRKSPKKQKAQPKPITHETLNEYKGDVMDYDGMGNYGRFPCINK